MQTGVQEPHCLQTAIQLPPFCLLHSSKLGMAGLTTEGQLFLETPRKFSPMNEKGPMYRQDPNN